MNTIASIAANDKRGYITPEDVAQAIRDGYPIEVIRRDLLQIIGRQTNFGVEDPSLCAFIAWRGTA